MTVDQNAILRKIGDDLATGREALSLWASGHQTASDALTRHLASSIRAAVNAAARDGDAVFNATLLHALGLTHEKPGRPRKTVPTGPIALAIVVRRGCVSETRIATKLATAFGVSANMMRVRVSEVSTKLREGREVFGFPIDG